MKHLGFLFKLGLAALIVVVFSSSSALGQQENREMIKEQAVAFLNKYEPKLGTELNQTERVYLVEKLARAAYSAEQRDKVRKYADELLEVAKKPDSGLAVSTVGLIVHTANIVLGMTALDGGDVDRAKEYLIAAGSIKKAHPVLSSFGPNMLLAKRLLDAGEKETVLKYFELCSSFWNLGEGRLKDWTTAVKDGKIPDFGRALRNVSDSWRFDGCGPTTPNNGILDCPAVKPVPKGASSETF